MSLSVAAEEELLQLTRNITRNTLGVVVSAALFKVMPWMLISTGYNLVSLAKNSWQIHKLKRLLREAGIKIKKRLILRGIQEGALTKLGTTFFFLGHDDFADIIHHTWPFLKHVGNWIVEHADLSWLKVRGFLSAQRLIDIDGLRYHTPFIRDLQHVASMPVEKMQSLINTTNAGWKAPAGDVAKQALLVGSVQAAVDRMCDAVCEDSYDHAMKSSKSGYDKSFRARLKRRLKFW